MASGADGEISFGGVNPARFTGPMSYVPVTKRGYWQVGLGGIDVGTTNIVSTSASAIVDSGTSYIGGPSAEITKIAVAVNATATADGEYIVSCTSPLPAISFLLGDKTYLLDKLQAFGVDMFMT